MINTRSFLSCVVILLGLAAPATAQLTIPLTLNGRIENAPTGACDPTATHSIQCSDLLLKSSTIDLSEYGGALVKLTGNLTLGQCPVAEVTSVERVTLPRTELIAPFGARLGRPAIFTTISLPGTFLVWFASCDSGLLPLGPFGTILLDIPDAFFWTTEVSLGLSIKTETIPNDPTLVGVKFHTQVAAASLLPTPSLELLNPVCLTIRQ